eukprot:GHVO01020161.1.p1 GENE.GHVO01020161.1~~GHVO01020161.1.p1  ORF type:complete len:179 (-),score=24.01 GHVO01020161.1:79-615(-)
MHTYPDIFHPRTPHPRYELSPLFKEGILYDSNGSPLNWEQLRGKSVALFFGSYKNLKSRNFLPMLVQFYKTGNESGDHQKIEVVYVSLDETEEDFEKQKAMMPWPYVSYSDQGALDSIKSHYRIMERRELPKYGYGRHSDPPALLIIDSSGKLLQTIYGKDAIHDPILRRWDHVKHRF